MKILGLTGGVGAGKSTVLEYLSKRYHARVIQADQAAHLLMEPGQVCYYKVVEAFGSGILNGDRPSAGASSLQWFSGTWKT